MALLSFECMKISVFCEVVKSVVYETGSYEWLNTNKLLGGVDSDCETGPKPFRGTLGCKTGVTNSAGPCFSGYFIRD